MNGDCCDASSPRPSNAQEKLARGWPPPREAVSEPVRTATGRRRRRRVDKQPTNNSLSVESSAASGRQRTNKPERVRLKTDRLLKSDTDPDSSSLFSEITSEDDAASIEIRLKQLVVEQEEILKLDDRYRSTPVLAHRVLNSGNNNSREGADVGGSTTDGQSKGDADQSGTGANDFVRAKSTNDLLTTAAAATVGGDFNFEHPAARLDEGRATSSGKQVPDVFVIQVDDDETGQTTDGRQSQDSSAGVAQRARALSIACSPRVARRGSTDNNSQEDADGGFMRRNVSSSFLPERGDLRNLNSQRSSALGLAEVSELDDHHHQVGRNRSNTAGSMDKSAMFSIGGQDMNTLADTDRSILSIHRSAWTLSDFDQTFNKSNLAEQQQQRASDSSNASTEQQLKFSNICDLPRGATNSDRYGASLLIKASKNHAMAGINQQNQSHHQQQQQQLDGGSPLAKMMASERRYSLSAGAHYAECSDRRPSFSHSIVSVPSSVDSYSQSKLTPLSGGHKYGRPSFSAGPPPAGDGADDRKGACLRSCLSLATMSQYLPILEWLPNYKLNNFYSDFGAGLAVAALNISTSLSAAVVAETDFGAAFRASIVNTFIYAILCSSKHVSFGSWSIMSQMLLISVKRALNDEFILERLQMGPSASWDPREYEKWHMNIIIMYTFLIGLVQLICGALNLGNILSSFIPEALCSSMIAATAFTMAIGQLANMCGTTNKILWQIERNTTELWADLKKPPVDITDLFANTFRWIQQIILLVKHNDQINVACVIISIISVILLFLNQYVIQQYLEKLFKRKILIPFEMVLLIVMILVSYVMDLAENYNVATCGPILVEFGIPNIPNLKLIRELWFNSLATALISYTMVYIMAKSYSNKLNYEVNYNQELIACGAGNLIGGLFDALPATASFSRTAGQVEAGGQTQMVSIINCVLLIAVTRLFGQYVSVLPICVMSAALFFGFCRMMTRFTEVFMYWRVCRVDCAIWVVTFVAILTADMVNGFIFGFIFSILTMLYRAQK